MKKNNPLKKLRLLKKTIAHLNDEQMDAARGGDPMTRFGCVNSLSVVTFDCPTVFFC
jgi:natural product precursor